ncbi:PucR family transcriptional regulator [Nocardioides abyssi]|uniref:Helix-turn-helix domain-containing protein n=1 Tax=Nocardioides abyssi TaxID=3058370 RepID=A0ABT8ERJ0_9ACTN|nr:helix-turn-helix domain-containing protein [Nocardioides abyssi]MDN4160739.1 helix-turn-helix domain-containing protein [Nocardioides abyssi]
MSPETRAVLAEHRQARVEPLTDRLVATIEATNPGYRTWGVVPPADLWRSCHDNVDRVLELLVVGDDDARDPADDPAYDAARATGRRRSEQGLPLDDVLRSFRLGGRLIWEDLVDQVGEELPGGEVREVGTRLWEVVDQTSAQVAAAYHASERAAVRADEQLRAELWEGLLSGRAEDPRFAQEAARILDLPVDGGLVVVTATGVDPDRLQSLVAPLRSSWVRRTGGVVGLVLVGGGPTGGPGRVVAALGSTGGPVGASTVVTGLAAVGTGFRQASVALRTLGTGGAGGAGGDAGAEAGGRAAGVASFDDRLPEALLLTAPEVAGRLVAVWLGPLLALPAAESDALLGTLEAWVAAGGSATTTAARVHCHRNTVLNRLRRVSTLLGRDLVDAVPPVELALALRAHRAGLPD